MSRCLWALCFTFFVFAELACNEEQGDMCPHCQQCADADMGLACGDAEVLPGDSDVVNGDAGQASLPTSLTLTEQDRFVVHEVASNEHIAFPSVTALTDGRLLLVYRIGSEHVDMGGYLAKQYGSADGTSWSASELLHDAPNVDDRDPSIMTTAQGELLLNYFQYNWDGDANTPILHHIFFGELVAADNSVGELVQVDAGNMSAPSAMLDKHLRWTYAGGGLIQVKASSSPVVALDDKLVIAGYGGYPLNFLGSFGGITLHSYPSRLFLFESMDNGQNWQERQVLVELMPDVWPQEPALLVLSEQHWIIHFRTAFGHTPGATGLMGQTESFDGGLSWSPAEYFDFNGHAPDLLELGNGAIF